MKFIFATTLATATFAAESDFPAFSSTHAHCEITTSFANTQCSALYSEIDAEIRSWATGGPASGKYAIYQEVPGQYVWSTRLTSGGKYTD